MKKFKEMVMIGCVIAFTSQLYLNFLVDGFRVSASVILFPILLLTYKDLDIAMTSLVTAILVYIFREAIMITQGETFLISTIKIYPGCIFYYVYGLILKYSFENNYYYDFSNIFFTILMCDFVSNIVEIILRFSLTFTREDFATLLMLFVIATTRSTIALLIIIIIRNYKNLLTKEEHEIRYQNLILIASDLKGEIYFMQKNVDSIENIMSKSYILYEMLSKADDYAEFKQLSLDITKDIHEIKKDYIRVIRGIEDTLVDKMQVKEMSIKDIFFILKESTYRYLENKNMKIFLDFTFDYNFITIEHYQIMSILSNLVNNSCEAFKVNKKRGYIKIIEKKLDNNYILCVEDNGEGIEKDNLDYIFNPGFSTKFDYTTGDVYRGVGLTHVKSIVTDYFKGTINVKSKYGKGTIFEITIPIENIKVICKEKVAIS